MWRRPVPAWSLCLAVGIALVCAAGWLFDQRPTATVWGSVGEFVGGLATACALGFAGYEIVRSRKEHRAREEEARLAAARSIGISSFLEKTRKGGFIGKAAVDGEWFVEFELSNASPYPIESVVVVIPDWGSPDGVDVGTQRGSASESVLGTVLPGDTRKMTLEVVFPSGWEPSFSELTGIAHVLFVDVWDQAWARGPGSVRKLESPPRIC